MSPTATNGINEAMVNGSESEFVKKVMELPAIQDIHKMASENKYGKIGIQMVGSAGNIVSNVAKPFQTQIKQADVLAASSIVYVEQTFPIVKRPTSEIVDGLKKPAMNIATSVQSQINQHAVEPTIIMAKKVDASLIGVVDKLESTLNTYLPEEDGTIIERSTNPSTDSADIPQTIRAINIAWTGQRRLTKRVKDQLSSTHSYTNEQLRQLQESSALLKSATDTVHKLNQMLLGVVLNVKDTVNTENIHSRLNDIATVILGDTHKNENLPTAVQARAVELSQSLLQTTDAIAKHVKENAKYFPVYLQDRSKPLTEFFEKRYTEIVGEIKDGDGTPIEKARNVIQFTTQHTLPLLNELQDSIHSYSTSLNHSFINTTEKVKSRFVGVAN